MHFVICIIKKVNYTYLNKITLILSVSECSFKNTRTSNIFKILDTMAPSDSVLAWSHQHQ